MVLIPFCKLLRVREGYGWKDGVLMKWVGDKGFYHKVGRKIGEY
jgi:hypothetical protein